MLIAIAKMMITQIRMNFGKLIMQRVKLFLIVPLMPLSNLAISAYVKGSVKIIGSRGRRDTIMYQSGSLMSPHPKNAK